MPKSRGRPPSRRKKQQHVRKSAARNTGSASRMMPGLREVSGRDKPIDWSFDEPGDDRRSWAIPAAHGTYGGIKLELLDPDDDDELLLLIEARHPELEDALRNREEVIVDGEPFNPTLHVTMHQVVARQLLDNEPPETWQTVQRLAGLGYDWHNIMHMIAAVVAENVHRAMTENAPFDAGDYARRLNALPGDWPPPESLERD